ncbi:MAG: 50S ribosomal protein L29 [Chloroflexota bacterium]
MEASEIRELSIEKLEEELDDSREELMRLRFRKATGELTNHNQLRNTRVKIARLLTDLRMREMAVNTVEEGEA